MPIGKGGHRGELGPGPFGILAVTGELPRGAELVHPVHHPPRLGENGAADVGCIGHRGFREDRVRAVDRVLRPGLRLAGGRALPSGAEFCKARRRGENPRMVARHRVEQRGLRRLRGRQPGLEQRITGNHAEIRVAGFLPAHAPMIGSAVFLVQQFDIIAPPLHQRQQRRLLPRLRAPIAEPGRRRDARDLHFVGRRRVAAEVKFHHLVATHRELVAAGRWRHDEPRDPSPAGIAPIAGQALEARDELAPARLGRIVRVRRQRGDRAASDPAPVLL